MVLSEAVFKSDTNKSNYRPVKNTIINKGSNIKPFTPTINTIVTLDKPGNPFSKKKGDDINELSKSAENRTFNQKKFAEERKKKLDQLRKTATECVKASIKRKPKIIQVADVCNVDTNLLAESNDSKIDQRWSPPPKIRNLQNKRITPINVKKERKTNPLTKLIDKKSQIHEIKNIEHFYSKLNLKDDGYELIDQNIFNVSTPENIDIDSLVVQNDDNCVGPQQYQVTDELLNLNATYELNDRHETFNCSTPKVVDFETSILSKDNGIEKLTEIRNNSEINQESNSIRLDKEVSEINLNTKILNTETKKDFSIRSNREVQTNIDNSANQQKLLIDQCSPSQICYSQSTQTDDYCNLFTLLSSKTCSESHMNITSVLKAKYRLQELEKNDLESHKSNIDLDMNEHSISNKLCMNNNNTSIENNVESTIQNISNMVDCDSTVNLPNLNLIGHEYDSNKSQYLLIDETIIPSLNNLTSKQINRNNVYKDQTNEVNNDEILINLNVNEDIKQVLMKNNHAFDNLLSQLHSSKFSDICNEFRPESLTLDQLNDSLDDAKKMGADMFFKSNESKEIKEVFLDDECRVLSNMMNVNKSIRGSSIQMFKQLIKDKELRALKQKTMLNLKEKYLMNCLKWEVTLYDVQLRHLELQPEQLQLIKQKQSERIKKLEQSMSQVIQLSRTIDPLHKKGLIMLNEQLQYLRNQS